MPKQTIPKDDASEDTSDNASDKPIIKPKGHTRHLIDEGQEANIGAKGHVGANEVALFKNIESSHSFPFDAGWIVRLSTFQKKGLTNASKLAGITVPKNFAEKKQLLQHLEHDWLIELDGDSKEFLTQKDVKHFPSWLGRRKQMHYKQMHKQGSTVDNPTKS